jgi:hypothetical protein
MPSEIMSAREKMRVAQVLSSLCHAPGIFTRACICRVDRFCCSFFYAPGFSGLNVNASGSAAYQSTLRVRYITMDSTRNKPMLPINRA